jgi:hypothetical protein
MAIEADNEASQNLAEENTARKAASHNLIAIYERQGKRDFAEKLKGK